MEDSILATYSRKNVSFKKGDGTQMRGERFFAHHTKDSIIKLLTANGFEVCKAWETSDARPQREDELWTNVLAKSKQ